MIPPGMLLLAILCLLLLNQHLQPSSRLRWQIRLLTTEFGHWLALLCLIIGLWRWNESAAYLVIPLLALDFARPAFQAWKIARARKRPFSILRLFWPFGQGNGVSVERRPFWQKGDEGLDVVIYRPPGASQAVKRRCVLSLHTGGWDSGDPGEFRRANSALVARCDVVLLSFGYRLAPEHPWPAQIDDVRRAVAWTRENAATLGIDADDLILLGRSAGAQIATACAYGCQELSVKGCIAVYGPSDMFFARKWSYPNDILKSLKLVLQYMGGEPEAVPQNYHSASATQHLREDNPRTLLIHGSSDCLVWVEHSARMHRMIADPARCDFLELPWGDHGCDFFPHSPGGQLTLSEMAHFLQS